MVEAKTSFPPDPPSLKNMSENEIERQYRKQILSNTIDEQQANEEMKYRNLLKQTKYETYIDESYEHDDEEIIEMEKSEGQYNHQLNKFHGISQEECYVRINVLKNKDKKEYNRSIKRCD